MKGHLLGSFFVLLFSSSQIVRAQETVPCTEGAILDETAACKNGYSRFNNRCYRVYPSIPNQSWATAEAKCVADGGHLTSMHSWEEHDFIRGLIKQVDVTKHYWTGMKYQQNAISGKWWITNASWADGTVVDYGNPASPWHPLPVPENAGSDTNIWNKNEDCAVLVTWSGIVGYWDDVACSRLDFNTGYICKRRSEQGCDDGNWKTFNGSCYLFSALSPNRNFEMAEQECRSQYDADLASIHSWEEHDFLRQQILALNGAATNYFYWFGLKLERFSRGNWVMNAYWNDGTPLDYGQPKRPGYGSEAPYPQFGPWKPVWEAGVTTNQPDNSGNTNENCGHFWGWKAAEYAWNDIACGNVASIKGYVCKSATALDSTWKKFSGNYYKVFHASAAAINQDTAISECKLKGAELTSVHSWAEHDFIRGLIYGLSHGYGEPSDNFWHGLKFNRFNGGNWISNASWSDGSIVNYGSPATPWWPTEPDNCCGDVSGKVNCVHFWEIQNSQSWADYGCNGVGASMGAVCQQPLGCTATTSTAPPP